MYCVRRLVTGLVILGGCCLGGCATPLAVTTVTDIRSSTGSRDIDVYEPKRRAGASVPEYAGDQLVEVRTYQNSDRGEVETAGATCSLAATGFSASMTSPAKVRVPLYRNQSSTLAVTCQMPGFQKRMVTVTPFDATRASRLASGSGGGLIGAVAVAAIDAAADNSNNDWRYPVARVVMEVDPSAR
jgi:hypothetical protein